MKFSFLVKTGIVASAILVCGMFLSFPASSDQGTATSLQAKDSSVNGPMGCIKSLEPIEVTLVSNDGVKTSFRVPQAYFGSKLDWDIATHRKDYSALVQSLSGSANLFQIRVMLDDMSAACLSPEYAIDDNRRHFRGFIDISVGQSVPGGFAKYLKRMSQEEYPEFVSQEGDFSVYQSRKLKDNKYIKGRKDFLVPQKGLFSHPAFILCARPKGQARSVCDGHVPYSDHVELSYRFHPSELPKAIEIDKKVYQLLNTLIIKNQNGSE